MDKPKATPKDFFLWAGAMGALYASVISFIALLFGYINYVLPDPLRYYASDPYSSGTAYYMASLIVLAPVFLAIMRVIRKGIERDPSRGEVWVRRWALYLTVFIAGATIAVDLIVLLNSFLSGQALTLAFLLKVLVVLLVTGAGFMHFLADLWGFWAKQPAQARMVNYAVGVLILVAIAAGFFILGTPWEARQARLDIERVNDLQSLQSQILSYYQQKQALPIALGQLEDPTLYYDVPKDPETGAAYEYAKTADLGFELCASFAAATRAGTLGSGSMAPSDKYGISGQSDWQHGAGHTCFVRSIDPDFFPPLNAPVR